MDAASGQDWRETPTWRPVSIGRRGAVASGHALATQAGLQALRAGGNAADAAIATATTLAVAEPQMSGVGGDGFLLFWSAEERRGTLVNASGYAPRAATPERFSSGLPDHGAAAASVPGLVAGWWALWQRFGTLPWPDLLAPAIAAARDGFGATRRFAEYIAPDAELLSRDPLTAAAFLPGGELPGVGTLIVQPDLARTLEELAADGAETFYRGSLGKRLAVAVQTAGGLISAEDLAEFEPEICEPLRSTYRGFEVLQAPPNSTGFTVLQELNILERFDIAGWGPLSAETVHVLVEIKKRAFQDREHGTDPRFGDVDLERILSKDYAARIAAEIDLRKATDRPIQGDHGGGGDTTYYAVVDGRGNAVSGIQSINTFFGAKAFAGDTGILLNDRMRYWHLRPGHPNRLAPGKRVRHTMNTPLVLQDGEVAAVFGTPGADGQVQINLQLAAFLLDFGLDPQRAVEAPRWRHYQQHTEANWPHTTEERLVLESRFSPAALSDLERRGHRLDVVGPLDAGCNAQAIVRDRRGFLLAGSDPRRDAVAQAW